MKGIYAEWNPKLMEVFTPAQLEQLDNVFMYLAYENNIPYQDSMYEAARDNEEDPDEYNPLESDKDIQEYYVLREIANKLKIYHEIEDEEDLPKDFFTNPKYSCNVSNRSI